MSNISITVNFSTYEEAAAFLTRPAVPPQAVGKPAKASASAPAATPIPAPAPTAEAPAPVATPIPAPAPAPTTTPITYAQVGEKIAALVAKDRPKAVEILASLGVKKGPDLKPEQWPAALVALDAALDVS